MTRRAGTRGGTTRFVVVGTAAGLVLGALGGWGASTAVGPSASAPSRTAASRTAAPRTTPSVAPSPMPSTAGNPGTVPAAESALAGHDPASVDLAATWTPPASMPTDGRLLDVTIPPTRSHFTARQALLWLPPAALTADPPALPVDVLLSGQSRGAGPADVQNGGHIEQTMDALATLDHGLAPIVVVPDQLGPQSANPMCVDGALGNSRTYLTRDVPAWVLAHLHVQTAASAWTIGGFSQGGTCAIQLGAGDPARFGNLVDVSGEQGPTLGRTAETIAEGFDGDRAAYAAARPTALLQAGAPFTSNAFFAAGGLDRTYGPVMPGMARAARAAGMHVATWVVPGGRHNWTTASQALAAGLAWLQPRIGLAPGDG